MKFTQHQAQPHDDAEKTEGVAHPQLKGFGNFRQFHAGIEANGQRDQRERQKRMHFEPRNQQHQGDDGPQRKEDQTEVVVHAGGAELRWSGGDRGR